jgi:hypothetical protein
MNRKDFIYTLAASLVLGLGSCTSEDFWDTFDRTVDGPIDFTVGVEGSPARRAFTRAADENNQTQTPAASESYYALQGGTQLRLRVDGMWKRVSETEPVSKQATCKAETSTSAVNVLTYDEGETLYWDDYGTGDPDNKDAEKNLNKDKGLSVLAVAVDGNTEAPAVADWTSLSWTTVDANGKTEVNSKNLLAKDILVSNNLTAYKFAERDNADAKKLIFKHPLSKITFNIKAGVGFTKGKVGNTVYKFENAPTVTLTNATKLEDISTTSNDYALTKGTVSIANAAATNDGTTKAAVIAGVTSTTDKTYTVIEQAIVYPDTPFAKDAVIAVIQADDNVYYIKADQIRAAMLANDANTDYTTKAGHNYIINVTLNKTGIFTTATVSAWKDVNSEETQPLINVDAVVGEKDGEIPTGFDREFDFWYSENLEGSYICGAQPFIKAGGSIDWSTTNPLYWPDHNTHYHLRGVYPTEKVDESCKYVEVSNGGYDSNSFPSNLMIGMPEFSAEALCGNPEHTQVDMRTAGICARTSAINLNFRYMMSQVEVNLTSKSGDSNAEVDLANAEVELVNVGTKGKILLSDRSAVVTGEGTFTLPYTSGNNYHGVIIPQTLVNGDSNKVKFKITVYADAQKTKKSVYYADVAPIKVKVVGSTDAAKATDAWHSGVHYVYNLNITKTQINATATLTDWTTVAASEEVWF